MKPCKHCGSPGHVIWSGVHCKECAIKHGIISDGKCKHKNLKPITPLEYEYTNKTTGFTYVNTVRRWECLDCKKTLESTIDKDACEKRQLVDYDNGYGTQTFAPRGQEV